MKQTIVTLALARGIKPPTIRKWRQRGQVPHKERLPLLVLAKKLGKPLAIKHFEFHSNRQART